MAKSTKPRKPHNPNKMLSKKPILIRYSSSQGYNNKLAPYMDLKAFSEGTGNKVNWCNLFFRLTVSKLSLKLIEHEGVEEVLTKGFDILESLIPELMSNVQIFLTQEQKEVITHCLEISDQIQDNTTSKDQLGIYIHAHKLTFNKSKKSFF